MRITRIENSKHVQERVLVYLEEGDPLRITGHELLQFGLYPGMDLSPQLMVQLEASGKRSEGRVKAAQLASGRMMSRKELADKLNRKGIAPDTAEEAVERIGHAVGGVCPFALPDDVKTYLDVSLKRFDTVFPAVGSAASAIELTCDELERCCGKNFVQWVDVCKGWQPEEA